MMRAGSLRGLSLRANEIAIHARGFGVYQRLLKGPVRMARSTAFVPVIRNYRVSHIAEVIAASAADPERAARATAICRRFDGAGFLTLPVQQMLELLEDVAAAAGIDDLGLQIGARYHPADWGAYGYLFLNSPTVLQALKSWVRVTREEQQGAHAQLTLVDEGIRLEYAVVQPTHLRRRQDAEMTLAVLMQAVRVVAGAATVPLAVHFEHARPRNTAPLRHYFRAPLHFGVGVNAIVFDRRLAAAAIPNADSRLLGVIGQFIGAARAAPRSETSIADLVALAIRPLLAGGEPSLQAVSKRLGMSSRTVQRRLDELGSSFGACLAAVRLDLAQTLLREADLEIKEVAFLLGYSGGPAFCKAFSHWTGLSPLRFRQREGAPPAAAATPRRLRARR
jgi:AraC-like DNA-binding protein